MPTTYTRVRDGQPATEAEAVDARGAVRDGYSIRRILAHGEGVTFDQLMFDAGRATQDAHSFFTDAAGKPVRLVDTLTGLPVALNDGLIAAMTSEAARLGVPVDRYVSDHLRYRKEA